MQDVLAEEARLLESEGLDPRWPGFGNQRDAEAGRQPSPDND